MAYGPAMLMVVASRGRDVPALRGISRTYEKLARLVIPTFSIGITFGFVAIFVHNFDPLLGWLVLAYFLVAASIIVTVVFTTPWLKSVQAAAEASPNDAPSPQLLELVNSPRNQALLVLDGLIIVALIADMVLKPLPGRLF
jgi:hypothetical protein